MSAIAHCTKPMADALANLTQKPMYDANGSSQCPYQEDNIIIACCVS